MNKKVSVIIVTYNPMKWIDKCLKSLKQSTISSEVIVVDNSSNDGSPDYIKENYPEVFLIKNIENLGFGAANNIGIKIAYNEGADYVFLLNQDAWIEQNTIENLIKAHQKEPNYGIVSPMHLNGKGDALDYNFSVYINPTKCKNLYSDIFLKNIKESIYEVNFVNAAAWLISRECMEKVGGFSSSFFHYGEDDNYIQRVNYHYFKVGILPTCVIYHDREIRKDNQYFNDEKSLIRRSFVLKFSNPFNDLGFYLEYKKLFKLLLKAIFFIKGKDFKKNFSKLKILNSLNKKAIIKNRNESRVEKPSFLN